MTKQEARILRMTEARLFICKRCGDKNASGPERPRKFWKQRAVEKILGVKVASVRVANYHGKEKRIPTRRETGRRSDWKKAYVRLKEGEKLPEYVANY